VCKIVTSGDASLERSVPQSLSLETDVIVAISAWLKPSDHNSAILNLANK
jgi:hypothetical protein